MNSVKDNPIGVFDSGLGGLTVLKEISKILPHEDVIYFGDTARVPYGPRSRETILKYTFQAINFLLTKNVKVIVIACNTATARALVEAQSVYDVPIIGVIKAGARAACKYTKNLKVGVIGTEGTIKSKAYNTEIHKIKNDVEIFAKACPLFVPITEEGWSNTDVAKLTAKRYLKELKDADVDSIVLGCTHYPLLKRTIGEEVGEEIKLVNPARETAYELKDILVSEDMENDKNSEGRCEYYVSDINERFSSIAKEFLKKDIENPKLVQIHKFNQVKIDGFKEE